MRCHMFRGLFLRANGDINCYCSTGEPITIAQIPLEEENYHFIEDIYLNDKFAYLRDCFAKNILPFPEHCLKCNYLDIEGKADVDNITKEIEWMHIEPMYGCNLACSFCDWGHVEDNRGKKRKPPYRLPENLYYKMLSDIADKKMTIKQMYFSGRGEPGLHPEIWNFVKKAKELFKVDFLVNTNGNINYSEQICESGLDKIKIAIEDPSNQEKYSLYRKKGQLDKLLTLTRNIAEHKRNKSIENPEIIWQKILFDFSDSDEELISYQKRAKEFGVDKVRFFFTFTEGYTEKLPEEIPRIFDNIEIHSTFNRGNQDPQEIIQEQERLRDKQSLEFLRDNFSLILKIMHWCENGIPNREAYDLFGGLRISDERVFDLRRDHTALNIYKAALQESLLNVANIYKQKGFIAQSEYYLREGRSIVI